MLLNSLDQIDLGSDPLVQEFVHKSLSRKYGDLEPPPELTKEQLQEVGTLSKRVRETVANATGHEIVDYIERRITIIAGPFAGATTQASDILTRLGCFCGHELLMREGNLFIDCIVAGSDIQAECSGDSLRWTYMFEKAPLIHLLRDPLKQCNSFFRLRNHKNVPLHKRLSPDECIMYTINFHMQMECKGPDLVWRIERPEDLGPVLKHFNLNPPMGRIDAIRKEAKKNPHRKGQEDVIKWKDFPVSLQAFCERYGYGPSGREIFENDEASW
jgi:hypothetical protein